MFRKKKCQNCREKIDGSYNFCPYCRAPTKELFDNEDWGMLGRNDFIQPGEIKLPMGLGKIFNSLMKSLNSQFNEMEKSGPETGKTKKQDIKKGGISISISTSGNRPPEIKVKSFGNVPEINEQKKDIEKKERVRKLPNMDARKFSGLPKKEPETNIRRFSEKVVYEISLPNVKFMKDVSIVQLENSIEIKALAKGKVFYKVIPINLPISKYNLSKGKLVLELDARE